MCPVETSASVICWLPPTSPRKKNLSHRLSNRAAAEEFARFSTLLTRDRGGTASTNNFTGQMTLLESDPAGTASTNSFTQADDPAPGRHRLFEQLHGADD